MTISSTYALSLPLPYSEVELTKTETCSPTLPSFVISPKLSPRSAPRPVSVSLPTLSTLPSPSLLKSSRRLDATTPSGSSSPYPPLSLLLTRFLTFVQSFRCNHSRSRPSFRIRFQNRRIRPCSHQRPRRWRSLWTYYRSPPLPTPRRKEDRLGRWRETRRFGQEDSIRW